MARIDVTELLSDPDFVDNVQIVSRQSSENTYGENVITESTRNLVGSVQPASGKALQRLPEALRVANVSSFWVKGEIVATADGKYPDLLVFKGKRYQVQFIFDWTNWGAGWTEGTCIVETPS